MKHELVIATGNRGKLSELRALLRDLEVEVRSAEEVLGRPFHVVEDGATFEDNAKKKAFAVAEATQMLTLADDSGLEVDALGGLPGVRSARFAGVGATDAENNAALIRSLEESLDAGGRRSWVGDHPARFRCVLALVDPYGTPGEAIVADGVCEGTIRTDARGSGGFGYDPLFVVAGHDRTMAELEDGVKNTVSHRARALAKMRLALEKVLAARAERIRQIMDG